MKNLGKIFQRIDIHLTLNLIMVNSQSLKVGTKRNKNLRENLKAKENRFLRRTHDDVEESYKRLQKLTIDKKFSFSSENSFSGAFQFIHTENLNLWKMNPSSCSGQKLFFVTYTY